MPTYDVSLDIPDLDADSPTDAIEAFADAVAATRTLWTYRVKCTSEPDSPALLIDMVEGGEVIAQTAGGRPYYVIENLVQYSLSAAEADTLERMGMIYTPDPADGDYGTGERPLTAFVWDDLGLGEGRAFDLFDAILGRKTTEIPAS